jgi:hypothetical protein
MGTTFRLRPRSEARGAERRSFLESRELAVRPEAYLRRALRADALFASGDSEPLVLRFGDGYARELANSRPVEDTALECDPDGGSASNASVTRSFSCVEQGLYPNVRSTVRRHKPAGENR